MEKLVNVQFFTVEKIALSGAMLISGYFFFFFFFYTLQNEVPYSTHLDTQIDSLVFHYLQFAY